MFSLVKYRSKNHHYVPRVLQRQFAAEANLIWYAERGKNGDFNPAELRQIKHVFCKNNHNTILIDGQPSDVVERIFYGKIDDYLGRVIPRILGAFVSHKVPTFTGKSLSALRQIVIDMIRRSPDFTKNINDKAVGEKILRATFNELSSNASSDERQRLLNDWNNSQRKLEIGRTARVRVSLHRSTKIDERLEDLVVRWVEIKSHHSFILSSLMVYRIGNGGPNGLSNPNIEIWFPISPKCALVLLRDPNNQIPAVLRESPEHVRQVNEFAATNSNQIASHSRRLIESITGKRAVEPRLKEI